MLPIKDLSNYLQNARRDGQDIDNIPVVEMGSIEVPKNDWLRKAAYITSFCLFLGLGTLIYNKNYTLTIQVGPDTQNVAEIVSDNGGSVYSVKKEDDTYKIRLFTLKNINSLIKKLRENEDFKKVELYE